VSNELDSYVTEAATMLGWVGTVLPPFALRGWRVAVVASLLEEPHQQRLATQTGPVLDKVTVETWGWPEVAHTVPPAAVTVHGVIGPARHWRTGLVNVVPFTALAPVAVLLPRWEGHWCVPQGTPHSTGVGVVVADGNGVDVLRAPQCFAPLHGTWAVRWILEAVYHRMLVTAEARKGSAT
jgi:hypothetical protein